MAEHGSFDTFCTLRFRLPTPLSLDALSSALQETLGVTPCVIRPKSCKGPTYDLTFATHDAARTVFLGQTALGFAAGSVVHWKVPAAVLADTSRRVYFFNASPTTTLETLLVVFSRYGPLVSLMTRCQANGLCTGTATYFDAAGVDTILGAVDALRTVLCSPTLQVSRHHSLERVETAPSEAQLRAVCVERIDVSPPHSDLYGYFSRFGPILSSRMTFDMQGDHTTSVSFAFGPGGWRTDCMRRFEIVYEHAQSAAEAISRLDEVNGAINNRTRLVGALKVAPALFFLPTETSIVAQREGRETEAQGDDFASRWYFRTMGRVVRIVYCPSQHGAGAKWVVTYRTRKEAERVIRICTQCKRFSAVLIEEDSPIGALLERAGDEQMHAVVTLRDIPLNIPLGDIHNRLKTYGSLLDFVWMSATTAEVTYIHEEDAVAFVSDGEFPYGTPTLFHPKEEA